MDKYGKVGDKSFPFVDIFENIFYLFQLFVDNMWIAFGLLVDGFAAYQKLSTFGSFANK